MAEAGFNINSFKSHVGRSGMLQNNKFLCRFYVPVGMQAAGENNADYREIARLLEYWCEATNLPGVALNIHEVRRYGYGPFEKRPHAPQFTDLNLQFYADSGGAIWTFWQQWIKLVMNYDFRNGIRGRTGAADMEPYELNYRDQYVADVEINVYDNAGKLSMTTMLREAYPVFVGDIPLNWGDQSNLMRIPVTLTFADWFNLNTQDSFGEPLPPVPPFPTK